MERHQRIARAIDASGKMKKTIADECGVRPSAVTQWSDGSSKSLKPENLYALAKATGFSAKWLAIGEGPERTSSEPGSPSSADYILIPRYDARAACGDGYLNDHVEVNGGLAFRRDWVKGLGAKPDDLSVIYAEGESMEPYIFAGDVVLIDTGCVEPRDRQVYALRRQDGSIIIKRMIQHVLGGWAIRSDNPDKGKYPDEPVTESGLDEIPILGRVVWRGGGVG